MKNSYSNLACAGLVGLALCGSAAAETVYSSIFSPLPGSYPSLGYEATSTDEFGDHVILAAGPRDLATVTVVLTDWACGNDYTFDSNSGIWTPDRAGDEACVTTPGATWEHPITANIYAVDNSGPDPAVGPTFRTSRRRIG